MKHRLFALFLALILAVLALTACSNTPEESKGSLEEATLPESSSETEAPTTEEPTTEEPTTEEPSTEPPVIIGVSVISDPQKTEYTVGEEFEPAGLGLLLQYDNLKFSRITEGFTIGKIDMSTAGKKEVEVTYEGFTSTFFINVFPQPTRNVNVGDLVDFGPYTWKVLAKDGMKTLLITNDIIGVRSFHAHSGSPWEGSAMREYLNGTVYAGFSEGDRNRIVETEVVTPDNPIYNISGGPSCKDRVFLLSTEESKTYFPDDASRIAKYNGEIKTWWLRSPGCGKNAIVYINEHGEPYDRGVAVSDTCGVRPAIWVIL